MLIHERFVHHRRKTPARECLVFEDVQYSYEDVQHNADRITHYLTCAGISAGDTVALLADRGPDLIWSILAVLQLGGVFVVVDSAYPKARIELLLDISRPKALLMCGREALSDIVEDLEYVSDVTAHTARLPEGSADHTYIAPVIDPKAPAYYLFTSGSTGQPKCVANNHEPLVNFIGWHIDTAGLTENDRFTLLSGLSHDPLLRDIFTPLSLGATLVIPRQSTLTDPGQLGPWMHKTGATIAHLTPPLGQLIAAGGKRATPLPRMRHFFWGGDQLPVQLLKRISALAPNATHTNFYGSTETPQAAAWFPCPPLLPDHPIPIGEGTRGFDILIVDKDKAEVRDGESGEIAVRSAFLSMGYVRNGVLVTPDDRRTSHAAPPVYFTGDRGYRRPDGMIVAIGRTDDQIKIRGYRIDLSEISAVLLKHPSIRDVAVLATGEGAQQRIAAFVVPTAPGALQNEAMRQYCGAQLPVYMIPAIFQLMEAGLPLLPNGKTDRQGLLELIKTAPLEAADTVAPANGDISPRLSSLLVAWRDIFPGRPISPDSSFITLGGDSLSYVSAYLAAEEIIGTPPVGWQKLSLAQIAELAPPKQSFVAAIDNTMFIRAVSICLIVALHTELTHIGEGATSALLVISGFLFGQSNWQNMFSSENKFRMLKPLKAICPPVFLFTYATILFDIATGRAPLLHNLLLSADMVNLWSPNLLDASETFHMRDGVYWYAHNLIKLIALTFLIQIAAIKFFPTLNRKLSFIAICTLVFALIRFIMPPFFMPDVHNMNEKGVLIFQSGPLANISLFYIGILCSQTNDKKIKLAMIAFSALFSVLNSYYFGLNSGLFLFGTIFSLLFIPRFPAIRRTERLIYIIAGASLYIYLGQVWLTSIVKLAQAPLNLSADIVPLSKTVVAIVGGVLIAALAAYVGQISRYLIGKLYPARPSIAATE